MVDDTSAVIFKMRRQTPGRLSEVEQIITL